ncbi:MAG: hypothetical protein JW803_00595 [Endomicrobiales bacterium]|nr:hypothetical protein [Endomicrobiales bacterium]
MKRSNFLKFVLFVALLVAAVTGGIYLFHFIPAQEELLRLNLFDRVKTAYMLSEKNLFKGAELRDDLMLLKQIESISKVDDIISAFILDETGKVITHNKTAEWGKTYADPYSKKALASKRIFRQKVNEPDAYLFSMPLPSSSTLCIAISNTKMERTAGTTAGNAALTGLIIFILSVAAAALFFRAAYLKRMDSLVSDIKAVALGGVSAKVTNDEMGKIAELVNEIASKQEPANPRPSAASTETRENHALIIKELADIRAEGIAVIDADNKVIAANQKAKELIFKKDLPPDSDLHILDAFASSDALELVKRSTENPGQTVEDTINGVQAKAKSLGPSKERLSGTIITLG